MKEIKTKFGTMYIEQFMIDGTSEGMERDKIKIFDSEERFFDYFGVEHLVESAKMNRCAPSDILEEYTKVIIECESIEKILDYCGICYELITTNWKDAAMYMEEHTTGKYDSPKDLLDNEWINKIGDHYIIVYDG